MSCKKSEDDDDYSYEIVGILYIIMLLVGGGTLVYTLARDHLF